MIRAFVIAAAVAVVNTAMSAWMQRRAKASGWFWQAQFLGFVLRSGAIFAGAGWIWTTRRRMPEVVVFILVAAIGQLAGQSYFLLKKGAPHA